MLIEEFQKQFEKLQIPSATLHAEHNPKFFDARDAVAFFEKYQAKLQRRVDKGKITPDAALQSLQILTPLIKTAIKESIETSRVQNKDREIDKQLKTIDRISRTQIFLHTQDLSQTAYATTTNQMRKNVVSFVSNPKTGELKQGRKIRSFAEQKENVALITPKTHHTSANVLPQDSFVAARAMVNQGLKPIVLDMANKISVGGGVVHGSPAQEEDLCRCSNLYEGLAPLGEQVTSGPHAGRLHFQPEIPEFGSVYVPGVTVFRNSQKNYELTNPFQVDVIALAGYDLGKPDMLERSLRNFVNDEAQLLAAFKENTKHKIRHMFDVAIQTGHDSLVLGALSCGAFKLHNDDGKTAQAVIEAYKEVLQEERFQNAFKQITFAVLPDKNNTFEMFKAAEADFNNALQAKFTVNPNAGANSPTKASDSNNNFKITISKGPAIMTGFGGWNDKSLELLKSNAREEVDNFKSSPPEFQINKNGELEVNFKDAASLANFKAFLDQAIGEENYRVSDAKVESKNDNNNASNDRPASPAQVSNISQVNTTASRDNLFVPDGSPAGVPKEDMGRFNFLNNGTSFPKLALAICKDDKCFNQFSNYGVNKPDQLLRAINEAWKDATQKNPNVKGLTIAQVFNHVKDSHDNKLKNQNNVNSTIFSTPRLTR